VGNIPRQRGGGQRGGYGGQAFNRASYRNARMSGGGGGGKKGCPLAALILLAIVSAPVVVAYVTVAHLVG